MIPNEVRLGNWVLIPTNNEIKIPCFPKKIKAITLFGEFDFTEPTYSENHLVAAKHCAGIELTEQLLIKHGASKYFGETGYCITCEDGIYPNSDIYILWDEDKKECYLDAENEYTVRRGIKYLHQLQNIYYDLKGEELPEAAA